VVREAKKEKLQAHAHKMAWKKREKESTKKENKNFSSYQPPKPSKSQGKSVK
jgi:hypothetical protein